MFVFDMYMGRAPVLLCNKPFGALWPHTLTTIST